MNKVAMSLAVSLITLTVFATDTNNANPPVETNKVTEVKSNRDRLGAGVQLGSTGIGAEAAVRLTHKSNLRGGFDFLPAFKPHFTTNSGIAFAGKTDLKNLKVQYDFFPRAGGFHISPGLLVSMSNNLLTATTSSTGGQYFSLNGNDYISDPNNPVKGAIKVAFSHRVAPMLTMGFGNLISRKEGKRFSVPFEVGLAFTGAPKSVWSYSGNVCNELTSACGPASASKQFTADVLAEQNKFNQQASSYKVYPIVSIGFGYKF